MKHFTYKTTNVVNGKMYYGLHSTLDPSDNYLGSGKLFKLALKKYGRSNFVREILEFFESREAACAAEQLLITDEVINSELYYNINPGGDFCSNGHSKATREKISAKTRGANNPMYGRSHSKSTRRLQAGFKGRKHTEETKTLMSLARTGATHSNESKAKISAAHIGRDAYWACKPRSAETKSKLGDKHNRFDRRPVSSVDADGVETTYTSKNHAAKSLGISSSNIGKACDGVYSTCAGLKWKYIKGA